MATIDSTFIKTRLQIANCCAVEMGGDFVDKLKKGDRCDDDLKDIRLIVALVNSIRGYVPEGEVLSSSLACTTYNHITDLLGESATMQIGSESYDFPTFLKTSQEGQAQEIADIVNADFPAKPFTAFADGQNVTFCGIAFDEDNGTQVTFTDSIQVQLFNDTLSGGAILLQEKQCIPVNQVEQILDKLTNLCTKSCKDLLTFTNEN